MSVSPDLGLLRASAETVNVAGTSRSSLTSTVFFDRNEPVVKLYLRSTSQNGYRTSPDPGQMGRVPPFLADTMPST